jgi:hypothetical protein
LLMAIVYILVVTIMVVFMYIPLELINILHNGCPFI